MAEAAKTGLTLSWASSADCALFPPHGSYCLATFPNVLEGGLASSSWRGTSVSKTVGIDASWSRRRSPGKTTRISSSKSMDSGTKIFRFGTRKKKAEAEDADDESNGAVNFGTQLLKFATRRGNSSTEMTTRGGPKKELMPLSLGRLGRSADGRTVFVAGATGQIGARISQQLLRSGFNVRGGVRDLLFAQQLAEFASQYGVISREEARRLNAVEFDFKDVESIAKAIGNAGKVVVTVGPTEDGPRGRVTAREALQVLEAANVANVGHIVIVSEGSGSGGGNINNGPLAGISGFFSKLFSRAEDVTLDSLLERVVETELRFTFLKASSSDGVDDIYPDGKSIVLLSEGTYNEGTGKVSKVQLASVVASVFGNIAIAENKVVEVATIDSAAARPIEELLSSIPVDGRRAALAEARAKTEAEDRERETRAQAEAEAREALEEARKTAELANQLEQEAKKLAAQEAKATANAGKAKARAQAAAASLEELGFKVKEFAGNEALPGADESAPLKKLDFGKLLSKTLAGRASAAAAPSEAKPEKPSKKIDIGNLFSRASDSSAAEGEPAKSRTPAPKRSKPAPLPPPPPKIEAKEPQKPQPVSILGGLFKQETIYVDE